MYYKKEALNDKLFPLQNGGSAVSTITSHILSYAPSCLNLFLICNTVNYGYSYSYSSDLFFLYCIIHQSLS
ncbi:hypothetical protein VNO80_11479 [Phaseolus coccineus]|uniref:Uncharacterized protein n=1 Tax=Phaseolus coccineus TaxID=3886 RepID=A0AAN9NFA2_PHACN